MVEALEELDVPAFGLGDRELREDRIRVHEDPVRDVHVLVTPEPRTAGEIHEQVGVGAERPHAFARDPVVFAVEVDERPAIAKPEGIERVRTGWRLIGYDLPVGRRTRYFAWVAPEPIMPT